MAVVKLANIYEPVTFAQYTQEAQTRTNRFINSGIAISDPVLDAQVKTGGVLGDLPHYNPLTVDEPNYPSDDPSDMAGLSNISSVTEHWRMAERNKAYSTMDLARDLGLADPVGAITSRIGHYWRADDEKRVINSLRGIMADNIANDMGDMVVDVAVATNTDVADANRISGDRLIEALQTLGDHKDMLTILAIHSQVHARLQKQQLISYHRDVDANIQFETYLGKRLLICDDLPNPTNATTTKVEYISILFAPGSVSYAFPRLSVPFETDRKPLAGGGGGQDILVTRMSNVWHINGFSFNKATPTLTGGTINKFADYGDLQLANNWDRIIQRKNVPFAFIVTND